MNKLFCLAVSLFFINTLFAQDKIVLSGSLQSDILLFPQDTEDIEYKEWGLTNTYFDLNARSKYVDVGARFEFMKFPLPGFEEDFEGWGVPHFYVTGKYKNSKLTVGNFYEQFGNGLIFRTYQERSLGIDNSIRGARFVTQPYKGINLKFLGGKQRRFFELNDSYIWGGDAEFGIEQWVNSLQESNTYLSFGTSYVGKHEKDEWIEVVGENKRLNLPINIGALAARGKFQKGNYSFMTEYAIRNNDPSSDNGYIYKKGNALLLSGSYSKRGMSILLQAKRSDNMAFRSKRTMDNRSSNSSFLNHLPAFTQQQTYALAALYPYATQIADGEWAFQGEFSYTFKRGTPLGGKYGTIVKGNVSHIRSIDKEYTDPTGMGTNGYTSSFFKMGNEIFYQDYILSVERKFTKDFTLNLMYMHQYFNSKVVAITDNHEIIKSNIFVGEGKYKINNKLNLRGELQYLATKQDKGNWMFGLLELSVAPSLMFTISDMYNSGVTNEHYYMASVTGIMKSHRLQIGYGRTREGYNCSGGVCRYIPETEGLNISYNYSF